MMNFERITNTLTQMRSMVLSLVMVAMVVALAVIVIRQLTGNTVVVKALNVPSQLEEKGYTAEVTAQLIVDGMQTIQNLANTRISRRNLIPDASRLDIEMPGSGLSVKAIGRVLRESLGISEATVSGEIVQTENGYQLHLRYIHGSKFAVISPLASESIDVLLSKGAEKSVEMANPFLLAAFLYGKGLDYYQEGIDPRNNRKRFEELLKLCFESESKEDDIWAYNLWGISLASDKKYDDAIEKYKAAIEGDTDFALAYNNWGNALLNYEKYEEAEKIFAVAVIKDRDLIPAMTGKLFAQGMNMYNDGKYQEAVRKFEAALERDPLFADAHARLGKALQEQVIQVDANADTLKISVMAWKAIQHYIKAQELDPDTYEEQLGFSIVKLCELLESLQ